MISAPACASQKPNPLHTLISRHAYWFDNFIWHIYSKHSILRNMDFDISTESPTFYHEMDLCNTCQSIDLESVTPQSLGTEDQVSIRSQHCQLCRLLLSKVHSLDKDNLPDHPAKIEKGEGVPEFSILVTGHIPKKYIQNQASLHEVLHLQISYYHPELGRRHIAVFYQTLQTIISIQDRLLSVQLGSNEANRGYGRRVEDDQTDVIFKEWLRLCNSSHPLCKGSSGRTKVQPKRLWVVNVREHRVMMAPPNCEYVALSYVWGPVQPLRLMMGNADELQEVGALKRQEFHSGIPQTIKDAMLTTLAVDMEFLWVDTLCIPQDDLESKQDLLQQMHHVYDNAVFTIVAAAGDHADYGLPGIQPGFRRSYQKAFQIGSRTFLDMKLDIDGAMSSGYQYSSWTTRGWTYEEALFSSRQLIFTDQQVHWHCLQTDPGGWREDVIAESTNPNVIDNYCGAEVTYGRDSSDTFQWYVKNSFTKFRRHANEYSQRQINRPHDALNAFKGIENALRVSYSEFIWGIPEVEFTRGMCWYFCGSIRGTGYHASRDKHAKNRIIAFPSWCWANWRLPYSTKSSPRWKKAGSGFRGLLFKYPGKRVTTFYQRDASGKFTKIQEGGANVPKVGGFDQTSPIDNYNYEDDECTRREANFSDMAILRFHTQTAEVFIRCYEHRKLRALKVEQFAWEDIPSIFCLHDAAGNFIATSWVVLEDDRDFITNNDSTMNMAPKHLRAVAIAGREDVTACLLTVDDKEGCRSRVGFAYILNKGSAEKVNDWLTEIIDGTYAFRIPEDTKVKGWDDISSLGDLVYLV